MSNIPYNLKWKKNHPSSLNLKLKIPSSLNLKLKSHSSLKPKMKRFGKAPRSPQTTQNYYNDHYFNNYTPSTIYEKKGHWPSHPPFIKLWLYLSFLSFFTYTYCILSLLDPFSVLHDGAYICFLQHFLSTHTRFT